VENGINGKANELLVVYFIVEWTDRSVSHLWEWKSDIYEWWNRTPFFTVYAIHSGWVAFV